MAGNFNGQPQPPSSGGTIVIYGQLTFYNVLTKMFDQEIMYDESHTDQIGYRYRIRIIGWLTGLPASIMGVIPTTGDSNAASHYNSIKSLLGPRQHFEYRDGVNYDTNGNIDPANPGKQMVLVDPTGPNDNKNIDNKDIDNGPKTNVFSITQIASNAIFRVEMEFEICTTICFPDGRAGNSTGVLNNRWSVVDDIDKNFYTVRTWSGRLRASSSQININAFRKLCVPPLQPGMRRERMQFAVAENGLDLSYTITDREIAFAWPAPATWGHASFSEEFRGDGELGFWSHCDISLMGDRLADRQILIRIAVAMAQAKFLNGVLNQNQNQKIRIDHFLIVDEYTDDGVFIAVRATAKRVDVRPPANGLFGLNTTYLGVPIGGLNELAGVVANFNNQLSRGSRPGEVLEINGPISMVGAFMAFLQSSCQSVTPGFSILNGIPGPGTPDTTTGSLPTVSVTSQSGIPDDGSLGDYDASNDQAGYTYAHCETHDDANYGRVVTPTAQTGTSLGQSQSQAQFSLGDTWDGTAPSQNTQSAVVGVLHAPVIKKEMVIRASRIGAMPAMPKPQDLTTPDGQKWKILKYTSSVVGPKRSADDKQTITVEANIVYAGINAIAGGFSAFFFGLNPWNTNKTYKLGAGAAAQPYQPGVDQNNLVVPFQLQ